MCLLFSAQPNIRRITISKMGIAVYGGYAIYKIFDTNGLVDWISKHHSENLASTMKAETPWIEESREFFGLIIILVVLAINYVYLTKYQRSNKT